jgi:hypothetical protein
LKSKIPSTALLKSSKKNVAANKITKKRKQSDDDYDFMFQDEIISSSSMVDFEMLSDTFEEHNQEKINKEKKLKE